MIVCNFIASCAGLIYLTLKDDHDHKCKVVAPTGQDSNCRPPSCKLTVRRGVGSEGGGRLLVISTLQL